MNDNRSAATQLFMTRVVAQDNAGILDAAEVAGLLAAAQAIIGEIPAV